LPEPIVVAIKNRLGKRFGAFEHADELSHRSAADLIKRAAAKDMTGAARAFANVTNGCVSCHRQFRTVLRPLSD
jgi:cytochrome c556